MIINFQLTAVAALLALSGVSQAALTTTSGSISFSGSASVKASQSIPFQGPNFTSASSSNTNNGATIADIALGKFDSSIGVLTGVDLQLSSNRSQTINGTGNKNQGPGRTASGSGSSDAALNAVGVSTTFSPAITQAGGSCALAMGPSASNCSWGQITSSSAATNTLSSVNSANLNDYVGAGALNASLSLPNLSATTTLNSIAGGASGSSTTYSVNWSGSLQANYSYLLHALASFDGSSQTNTLTLDFGNVTQNSIASLNFGLFNLANANRTGLDLVSVVGSGDTSAFYTTLSGFTNLAQGGNQLLMANLLTADTGAFSAQYILNLSDTHVGASSTWQTQQLTLHLVGNVSAVPEPSVLWLFSSGLLGLMSVSWRKQPSSKD